MRFEMWGGEDSNGTDWLTRYNQGSQEDLR